MRYIADFFPQVVLRYLADINAVNENTAAGNIIKARDKVNERGFAAAGASD